MTSWTEATVIDLADGKREFFNDGDWVESPFITTSGNRLLQTGNIGVSRLLNRGTKRYVSDDSFRTLRCKEVVPGDILICRLADPAGRACLVRDIGESRMLTSVDVTIYRPNQQKVDRRFLVALFSTPAWFQEVSERCGGSTRTRIARSELGKIKLILPPIEEQTRIADALAAADDLIASLERLIAKKQAIKKGMIQQLLTGRTRLPGFDSEWRRATIGSLSDQHRRSLDPRKEGGRRFQHFSLPAFDDGEMPVDQFGMQIDSIKFVVPQQAILVSKLNPRIPRIWAPNGVGVNAIASTEFVVMTPKPGIDRLFLMWLMKSDAVTSRMKLLATGTTGSHARIHPRQIAALEVVIPEEAEQVSIATILDEVSHEIGLINDRLVKARAIKTGMMQQLLTGRTRLPVEVSS